MCKAVCALNTARRFMAQMAKEEAEDEDEGEDDADDDDEVGGEADVEASSGRVSGRASIDVSEWDEMRAAVYILSDEASKRSVAATEPQEQAFTEASLMV